VLDRWKTYALVTGLTVLVWAFAEVKSLRHKELAAELILDGASADRMVRFVQGGTTARVQLSVEGSNAAVDALEEALRTRVFLATPADPGTHAINVRESLKTVEPFDRSGVTIAQATPETLEVEVVAMETRELPVRVLVTGAETEGPVTADPAVVAVRLPAGAELGDDAHLEAKVSTERLRGLSPGRAERIGAVALELPDSIRGLAGVSMTPAQVEVVLTLRSRTASVTLPSVPVHVQIALVESADWLVTPVDRDDTYLRDVTVTGPSEDIARVESGELRVTGRVVLGLDELERAAAGDGVIEKDVEFAEVPTPLRFDAESLQVRLKVERRGEVP